MGTPKLHLHTMLVTALATLATLVSVSQCIQVVRYSPPSVVKGGEDTELFCDTDTEFEHCSWYLPSGVKCGPLSETQSMCRASNNIHFKGTNTSCKIQIQQVKSDQSGSWTCSISKEGGEVNTTVELTEAMAATVDWSGGIFGTITLTQGNPSTVTCQALHSRPVGLFLWHLGPDDSDKNRFVNENEIIESVGEDKIANVSQSLTLDPKPLLNDQRLYCTYIQEDQTSNELFRHTISIELKVHYLSDAKNTPITAIANS